MLAVTQMGCMYLPSSPKDPLLLTFMLRLRPPIVSAVKPLGTSFGKAVAALDNSSRRMFAWCRQLKLCKEILSGLLWLSSTSWTV